MAPPRLLFAAWHCWLDPSSGAAISARDLLAVLARRGWDVRVLCGPRLDFDRAESIEQLVADQCVPDVVLTYGGNWLAVELMRCSRRHGPKIVFWLRNFAYKGARLFDLVDGVLVPSRCSAEHYQRQVGISCTAIPSPLDRSRVRCQPESSRHSPSAVRFAHQPFATGDGRHSESACYVTFVNPQPAKGVFVFARIAHESRRVGRAERAPPGPRE
jgi:hypothetical protein